VPVRPALQHLDTLYQRLLDLLNDIDEPALNWKPAIAETNSIAILVAHTVGATGRWLSNAAGDPRMGDRPAEFRTRATPAEAIALVRQARVDARDWLGAVEGLDPATPRPMLGEHEQTTLAWCVEHALTHAHEHWGQIQLTLQLAQAANGSRS
jgi:uncharacterized damage-inducible protein DinB